MTLREIIVGIVTEDPFLAKEKMKLFFTFFPFFADIFRSRNPIQKCGDDEEEEEMRTERKKEKGEKKIPFSNSACGKNGGRYANE